MTGPMRNRAVVNIRGYQLTIIPGFLHLKGKQQCARARGMAQKYWKDPRPMAQSQATAETRTPERPPAVTVSESAAKRIGMMLSKEEKSDLKLRVSVSGGGCSGFQYGFDFDENVQDDDTVIEDKGVTVLIDGMSLMYLLGSEIDYVEDLVGASFQVTNPNAASSCGCGSSFSI